MKQTGPTSTSLPKADDPARYVHPDPMPEERRRMTLAEPLTADPRIEFERRYCYQALESAVARGEPEILVRGPRGTGKTITISDFNYRLGLRYGGMKQVWLRADRTDMTETVLAAFEDEVLGIGHPLRSGAGREGRKGYDLGNGTQILLRGMKGPDATKSMSADLIWPNECNELTETQWEEIDAANRERVGATSFPFQCKIGDFNPMPPSHWTNTRCPELPMHLYPRVPVGDEANMGKYFTPQMYCEIQEFNFKPLDRGRYKAKLIVSTIADNPGYWSIDPWGWKPGGLKYCLDKLAKMGTNRRARYLEGRPVAVENVVYGEFDREQHVIKPFPWPKEWPVWLAYDPGYSHPCGVLFWGMAPSQQPYIIDEIWGSGINIDRLADDIKRKAPQYRIVDWLADPRGANQKTQVANGKTVMQYMAEQHHLYFRPWRATQGSGKQSSVEKLRVRLTAPAKQRLQVFETCVGFISNMETWKNKTNAKGELLTGDDAYEDRDNDLLDPAMGVNDEEPAFNKPSGWKVR